MGQSIGKVNPNGTLNDGAFYSIKDVNVLLEGEEAKEKEEKDTNVTALKGLYVALGGNAEDVASVTTIDGMIEAISELNIGGGGGSAALVCNMTFVDDGTYDKYFVTDALYADIEEAYNNGTTVIFKFPSNDSGYAPIDVTATLIAIGGDAESHFGNGLFVLLPYDVNSLYGFNSNSLDDGGHLTFEIYID